MEQIPKTVIDNLSEKNTVLINDFFAQQAAKFNVTDDCEIVIDNQRLPIKNVARDPWKNVID
jgi:hypothetical protein